MKQKHAKESSGLHMGEKYFSIVKMRNNVVTDFIVLPNKELNAVRLKNVSIALSDENIISKILKFNTALNENEIEKHLKLESKYYFGCEMNELFFDFKILQYDQKQTSIYVVACKRKEVLEKIAYLKNYKINIKVIDIVSLAIARTAQFICERKDICYFYYDSQQTIFAVLQQKIIYCRKIKLVEPIIESKSLLTFLNQNLELYFNLGYNILLPEIILIGDEFSHLTTRTDINRSSAEFIYLQILAEKKFPDLFRNNKLTDFVVPFGLALWK